MTGELFTVLFTALLSFLIGFGAGQFLAFRRVHSQKGDTLQMEIDKHPFGRGKLWPLALIVLFLTATWYVVDFSQDQRTCNREFRAAIAERAAANADTERARQENDDALVALVRGLLEIPAGSPEARDTSRLLEEFTRTSAETQQRAAENAARRAANPYPKC